MYRMSECRFLGCWQKRSAMNAKTPLFMLWMLSTHHKHFFLIWNSPGPESHALFTGFISTLVKTFTVPYYTQFSLLLMQFSSCRKKYHPWRPHLYSSCYKGEAKSQTQQAGISILPICRSSLGDIHWKWQDSLGKKKKKKTTPFHFQFSWFLLLWLFTDLVSRCLKGVCSLQYSPPQQTGAQGSAIFVAWSASLKMSCQWMCHKQQ